MAASKDFFSRFPPVLFVVGLVALVAVVALLSIKGGTFQIGSGQNRAGSLIATDGGLNTDVVSSSKRETITCNFLNAYSMFGTSSMNCSSTRGSCQVWANTTAPSPSCTVNVVFKATKTTKVTWSSSQCYGNPITTLDGVSENITFQCNPNLPLACTDPDGVNYTRATNVTVQIASGAIYTIPDICLNSTILLERTCGGVNPYNQSVYCPGGCSAGKCLPPPSCTDSDGIASAVKGTVSGVYLGGSYYILTDSCFGTGTVLERICNGVYPSNLSMACNNSTCVDGACVPNCQNECTLGTKQCITATSARACGNYDADSCTEWSNVSTCQSGMYCSSGTCVPQAVCQDSDGNNTLVAGYVWGVNETGNYTMYDTCSNWLGPAVYEYTCDNNYPLGTRISCMYNCTSGACTNQTGNGTG